MMCLRSVFEYLDIVTAFAWPVSRLCNFNAENSPLGSFSDVWNLSDRGDCIKNDLARDGRRVVGATRTVELQSITEATRRIWNRPQGDICTNVPSSRSWSDSNSCDCKA